MRTKPRFFCRSFFVFRACSRGRPWMGQQGARYVRGLPLDTYIPAPGERIDFRFERPAADQKNR